MISRSRGGGARLLLHLGRPRAIRPRGRAAARCAGRNCGLPRVARAVRWALPKGGFTTMRMVMGVFGLSLIAAIAPACGSAGPEPGGERVAENAAAASLLGPGEALASDVPAAIRR